MSPADLRAWLARRGLSERAAAPLLAAAQQEVNRWARGERKVPRRVARIIELLDRLDACEGRAAGEPEPREGSDD